MKRKSFSLSGHLIIFVLIAFWIVMMFASPTFRSLSNTESILREASITGIAAIGMTYVIIMGDFDLSIGSMLAMVGIMSAAVLNKTDSSALAVLFAIVLATICGLLNGLVISYCNLPAFIMTLGTYYIYRAGAYIFNKANGIPISNKDFISIANNNIGILPIPFILMILVGVVAAVLLNRTVYGREVTALGNSVLASRVSGIDTKKVKMIAFGILGFCTGISAVLTTGRQTLASPDVARNFHFDAITMVVLGGTKLSGGEGSIANTVFAAVLYALITNLLNQFHVDAQWQRIVMGIILLVAFSFDFFSGLITNYRTKKRIRKMEAAS
ncbi:MAG: ABC transporter permease [Eubacterium sp.]|nr:ABC transporter permease [Eubacterium sp.]